MDGGMISGNANFVGSHGMGFRESQPHDVQREMGFRERQVMLAYNLWRWMKLLAGHAERQAQQGTPLPEPHQIRLPDHTLRIARLKLLYVAAKIRFHDNRHAVLYSIHEQRG